MIFTDSQAKLLLCFVALTSVDCARISARPREQPSSVTIPGSFIEATLTAADDLFQEFEKPRRDNFGHHRPTGQCDDDIQGFEVEVREIEEAYEVELVPAKSCPVAVGGGGHWQISKENFRLLSSRYFE